MNITNNTHNQSPVNSQKLLFKKTLTSMVVLATMTGVGCRSDNDNNKPDKTPVENKSTLVKPALLVKEFTSNELMTALEGISPSIHALTEQPKCDVVVKKYTFKTHGAKDEVTESTAAIMIPEGDDPECQGDRPILMHAHGTTVEKSYDFSQVGNYKNGSVTSATAIATNFAGQGYIVVAPNYVGYDESDIDYHPYLNAKQQSHEMADALVAAKEVLDSESKSSASDQLFLTGYSQGGHVALATARHFEMIGQPITASAPMSGPYAMTAFGDSIFNGDVNLGATILSTMIAVSYNKAYGNLYNKPSDIVNEKYADGLETIIPGSDGFLGLIFSGKLPMSIFENNPANSSVLAGISPPSETRLAPPYSGFNKTDYLVTTKFREAYVKDMIENPDGYHAKTESALPAADPKNPMRQALKANDLRLYLPKSPVMLCGGNQDPMVFFDVNTGAMNKIWQKNSADGKDLNVIILDVDKTNEANRGVETVNYIGDAQNLKQALEPTINQIQSNFETAYNAEVSNGGSATRSYHSGLTAPACFKAATVYFDQFKD